MSTLLERISRPGRTEKSARHRPPARPPVLAGALAAGQAAAASGAAVLVPVVIAWTASPSDHTSWSSAVRLALYLWLLGQHTGIAVSGGHVGLVPLGLLLVSLLCCWFAGVRLARGLDPNAAAIGSGVGRSRPVLPPGRAVVSFIGSYALLATLASAVVAVDSGRPLAAQALLGAGLVASTGGLVGVAAWPGAGARGGFELVAGRLPIPPTIRRWLRGGALAVAGQLIAGLLLFGVAVGLGWHRVLLLQHALAPGVVGGAVLVLLQLALLPNAAVWGMAFLAGPGFAIGSGTAITPAGTRLGTLPALPMLGALPMPGTHPSWFWAGLAVPGCSGLLAVLLGAQRGAGPDPRDPLLRQCRDAVGTGLASGLLAAGLAWLSAGPVGPGRLAQVGPSSWQLGAAVAGLVGAAALVAVLARTLVSRGHRAVRGSPPADPVLSGSSTPPAAEAG